MSFRFVGLASGAGNAYVDSGEGAWAPGSTFGNYGETWDPLATMAQWFNGDGNDGYCQSCAGSYGGTDQGDIAQADKLLREAEHTQDPQMRQELIAEAEGLLSASGQTGGAGQGNWGQPSPTGWGQGMDGCGNGGGPDQGDIRQAQKLLREAEHTQDPQMRQELISEAEGLLNGSVQTGGAGQGNWGQPWGQGMGGYDNGMGGYGNGGQPDQGDIRLADRLLREAEHTHDPQKRQELIREAEGLLNGGGQAGEGQGNCGGPSSPPGYGGGTDGCGNGGQAGSGGLSVNGNTIDTGRYLITVSGSEGGDVKIYDKESKGYVNIWGDPHISTSTGEAAEFQKGDLTIALPDGTKVTIKPTAVNSSGVAYVDQVAVTRGNGAVVMSGVHSGDIQNSGVMDYGARRVDHKFADGTVLDAGRKNVGNLYLTNAYGDPTKALGKNGSFNLDGLGGAVPYSGPSWQQIEQQGFNGILAEQQQFDGMMDNMVQAQLAAFYGDDEI
jgi:hypothetical protein